MNWHGYPQHPDAHPERPWWHREGLHWRRIDGWGSDGGSIASMDAKMPLPPPEPRCLQVWLNVERGDQVVVACVDTGGIAWSFSPNNTNSVGLPSAVALRLDPWPPPGAVLVAGPGSPWAPMGEGVIDAAIRETKAEALERMSKRLRKQFEEG